MAGECPFQIGAKVRLKIDVASYPLGVFPAGTTGTVSGVIAEPNPVAGLIKLDQHFECLDEWDNELQVFTPDEGEVIWDYFEAQEG